MQIEYDICVIGMSVAGIAAARVAHKAGARTVIVDLNEASGMQDRLYITRQGEAPMSAEAYYKKERDWAFDNGIDIHDQGQWLDVSFQEEVRRFWLWDRIEERKIVCRNIIHAINGCIPVLKCPGMDKVFSAMRVSDCVSDRLRKRGECHSAIVGSKARAIEQAVLASDMYDQVHLISSEFFRTNEGKRLAIAKSRPNIVIHESVENVRFDHDGDDIVISFYDKAMQSLKVSFLYNGSDPVACPRPFEPTLYESVVRKGYLLKAGIVNGIDPFEDQLLWVDGVAAAKQAVGRLGH